MELQQELHDQRLRERIPDTWLIGEHPLVITEGVRARAEDTASRAVPVFRVDRGGMTTLHSPGQLILYPIVKVRGGALAGGRMARALLEAMRIWLKIEFGVEAGPLPRQPGLYVEGCKLLSIGLSVRRGVSMHGVALNLCNDLSLWSSIVPCGEPETRLVSLSQLLGRRVEPGDQVPSIRRWLLSIWNYSLVECETGADVERLNSHGRFNPKTDI